MPALPVLTGAEPVSIKRCFWDCGTHKGGQKQLAGICHDLTVKYDYDKSVRCQIGQPYTAVVKSRCVMCSDVAEGGPKQAKLWPSLLCNGPNNVSNMVRPRTLILAPVIVHGAQCPLKQRAWRQVGAMTNHKWKPLSS